MNNEIYILKYKQDLLSTDKTISYENLKLKYSISEAEYNHLLEINDNKVIVKIK